MSTSKKKRPYWWGGPTNEHYEALYTFDLRHCRLRRLGDGGPPWSAWKPRLSNIAFNRPVIKFNKLSALLYNIALGNYA